jgi:hypothetical protein
MPAPVGRIGLVTSLLVLPHLLAIFLNPRQLLRRAFRHFGIAAVLQILQNGSGLIELAAQQIHLGQVEAVLVIARIQFHRLVLCDM